MIAVVARCIVAALAVVVSMALPPKQCVRKVLLSAVAQSNGLAQTAPATAALAPLPWYETPTWSQQPHHPCVTSSVLQQLWLSCPHSFSQLLTPWASTGLSTHPNSCPDAAEPLKPQESMSVATAKLSTALRQHVQMLACGNSGASVAMLHDLVMFLEAYHLQRSAVHESLRAAAAAAATRGAASYRPLSQGLSNRAGSAESAESQTAAEAASEVAVAAALQVVSVLVAHDKACQQVVVQLPDPQPDPAKTHTQVLTIIVSSFASQC